MKKAKKTANTDCSHRQACGFLRQKFMTEAYSYLQKFKKRLAFIFVMC